MTQSGVSQHIRKLEDTLDQPLLIRQGKQFTLTDSGERLYQEARAILSSLAILEQKVKNDPPYAGTVRIMSPGSVGLKLYPQLLKLQQRHPELMIDYRFAPNPDIEKAIIHADIDMGLMTQLSTLDEINSTPIAKEPLLLITPDTVLNPNWEQLLALGFIDHPDGAHHASLLLGANFPEFVHINQFKKRGFSNQIGLILEPVSMGLGFTVLPAFAVDAFSNQKQLQIHRLSTPITEILYLGFTRNKPVSNRVKTVIEETKKWL